MNWIRKTVIFIGLSMVFLFACNANGLTDGKTQTEKNQPSYSIEHAYSSVFIQPEAANSIASHHKNTDFSISKHFENFLVAVPGLKIAINLNIFANQDIDRCEMVSLLLFPFHYFW